MQKTKLGSRFWWAIGLCGFIGQLAWAIENNYINLWAYSQTGDAGVITWMTAVSSIAATVTTFLMGTLSDRIGKRRLFISIGYIIWGFSVFAFGLGSRSNMSVLFGAEKAILGVGIWMIVVDGLMTFFGSTANDAAFNSFVTDQTDATNRGWVESILAPMPLFANVVMLGIGIPLAVDSNPAREQAGSWLIYFLIIGMLVAIIGIVSLFFLPKDKCQPSRGASYGRKLIHGFRPSVIKENKELYIVLLVFLCFNTAINAFMPYYMVYMQNPIENFGLNIGGLDFYITMGAVFIGSAALAILNGIFLIDRVDRLKLLFVSFALTAAGCLGLALGRSMAAAIIGGVVMMTGYLVTTSILGAMVRDRTPNDNVGLFQGVKMIFCVLIPMIVGPLISKAFFPNVISAPAAGYDALNGAAPTFAMFYVALAFIVLSLVPTIWLSAIVAKNKKTAS